MRPVTKYEIGFFSIKFYLFKIKLPFVYMPITFPFKDLLIKLELYDLLLIFSLVKMLSSLVLNKVISAGCSSVMVAAGRLKIFLAFTEKRAAMPAVVNSGNTVLTAVKAVSNPIIPFLAYSNSQVLLSQSCGRWCVAMQSTKPFFTASLNAIISALERKGGFTFKLVSYSCRSSSQKKRW